MTSVVDVFCGVVKPGYGIGVASYSKHFSTYGESYTTTNTPYQVRHCRCEVLKRAIFIPRFFFVIYRNTKRLLSSRIRTTPLRLLRTIRVNDFSLFSAVLFHCWLQNWGYSTAASYFSAPSYASLSYKAEAESHYATTATYYTSTAYTTSGYYTTAGYYYESTAYFAYTTAAPHYDVAPNYGADPTITSTSPSQRVLIIQRQLLPLMATGTKSMVTIPLLLATHMDLLPSPKL
jgi:hypothetical protein